MSPADQRLRCTIYLLGAILVFHGELATNPKLKLSFLGLISYFRCRLRFRLFLGVHRSGLGDYLDPLRLLLDMPLYELIIDQASLLEVVLPVDFARLDGGHKFDVGRIRDLLLVLFALFLVIDVVHLGESLLEHVLKGRQTDTSQLSPPLEMQIRLKQTSLVLIRSIFAVWQGRVA